MSFRRPIRSASMLAVVLTSLVLGSCDSPAEPGEEDVLRGLGPGIHPVLAVASRTAGETTIELHFEQVDVDVELSGFQGELTFDTSDLTFAGADLPGHITGAWNEVERGRVRFAGVALDGVGENHVLTLRFRTRQQVSASAFTLRIEEVIATTAPEVVTSRVVARERPLFSRVRLR